MAIEAPILIFVSVTPSVSDQPAGHFVRSTVQPSGPVSVLPSAETPHLLSLMRFTMAARCCVHSASHPSIVVGAAAAVVEAPAAVVVAPPAAVEPVAALVVVAPAPESPLLSSPPQAAASSAKTTP